jgi:hypothetical protein
MPVRASGRHGRAMKWGEEVGLGEWGVKELGLIGCQRIELSKVESSIWFWP